MNAKEYYEEMRKAGFTDDITSNDEPDYNQAFYQSIFRLMEGFSQKRKITPVTEFEDVVRPVIKYLCEKHPSLPSKIEKGQKGYSIDSLIKYLNAIDEDVYLSVGTKEKNMFLTRELFVETIEAIKKQYQHDIKCSHLLQQVYSDGFDANLMYQNHYIMNQLVKLLQVAFNDETEYSMIEYFMWELDFGEKNNQLSAYRADKSKIDLSDAGKLYDYLTENITTSKIL